MSGGVDSAVAALLLLNQKYQVEGLFMKNWEEDDTAEYCTAADDLRDAQQVCDRLGITLHTVNFSTEYWDRVFAHFLAEYEAGRTPNPDVMCNKEIKFKAFLDYALDLGADHIATGHYAQVSFDGHCYQLLRGLDQDKDQSYFLYLLGQRQLSRSLFPLGPFRKSDVRKMASEAGFENHSKKDSTGICFIGERKFKHFLEQFVTAQPGKICTVDGTEIGDHQGLSFYTLGQRQGLGIGGNAAYSELPWFVAEKDLLNNRLIVVQGTNHPKLFHKQLTLAQIHWIAGLSPELPLYCTGKIRYRQSDQECSVTPEQNGSFTVRFKDPQRAVTPGQSMVLYQDQICLGGGIIQ